MSSRSTLSSFVLILIGVIAGAVIFSQLNQSTQPQLYSALEWQEDSTDAADRPLSTLRDLNQAFVDIASNVNPTVVTVFTEKVMKVRGYGISPFFESPFEDFFRDFFGQPRPRQPQEREYRQQGLGSGVIVSKDGYILTNNHVVADADTIYVRLLDNRTVPAKVIGTDPKTDIAVLKIEEKKLHAIRMGDSDKLQVGEWVLAVGSPMSPNLAHTVTSGIVSAKGRSNMGLADYEDFIQTDAAINPGNSGGALINLDGQLVGINSAIVSKSGGFQGIGFAVPINMARSVMESFIKYGTVIRGWLGVYMQDVTENLAKAMHLPTTEGALVGDVSEGSPADKAGIKEGDVLIELNGKKIINTSQLRNEIASTAPDTEVELKILRHGKEMILKVKLGKLAADKIAPETEEQLEKLFGFTVSPLTSELAQKYHLDKSLKGVVITDINPASAAARAGLRVGDLITGVNRREFDNMEEFNKIIQNLKKNDTVFFRVVRQNRSFFVAFTL